MTKAGTSRIMASSCAIALPGLRVLYKIPPSPLQMMKVFRVGDFLVAICFLGLVALVAVKQMIPWDQFLSSVEKCIL